MLIFKNNNKDEKNDKIFRIYLALSTIFPFCAEGYRNNQPDKRTTELPSDKRSYSLYPA